MKLCAKSVRGYEEQVREAVERDGRVEWFFNDVLVATTRTTEPFSYVAGTSGLLRADLVHGECRTVVPFNGRRSTFLAPAASFTLDKLRIDCE